MENKKILVTGTAGFIGSHLCEELLKNNNIVYGVDNFDPFYDKTLKEENLSILTAHKNFTFYNVDIRESAQVNLLPKVDIVVHLAAKAGVRPSIEDPSGYILTNIVGSQNILEWMKNNDINKLAFASSSSVYGNNDKIPFAENDIVDFPISPYAFTKKAGELLNHTYHSLYNIDIINMRFFTVFGERQRPDLAFNKFVRLALNGEAIPMFGDGSTSRDYTYVKDTAAGIIQAMNYVYNNTNVFETINLGNNSPIKLKDLIATIYELLEIKPNIKQLPMQPGDVNRTFADIKKAEELIGYSPKTDLKAGLKKFIDWYKLRL